MKLISELRLKLFADEICFQARRIATSSGGEIDGRIPVASFEQSILNRLRPAGNNLAGCSLETLTMLQGDVLKVGCLR
jgi:hypothetical protein